MNQPDVSRWYNANKKNQNYYGTFADNRKAPIHRWFKYPAGYSYRLVERQIRHYSLNDHSWILDPFVGCGTTLVEAKKSGVNSIGIEYHPFICWVARTKTFWEFDFRELHGVAVETIDTLSGELNETRLRRLDTSDFPELLGKCFSVGNLAALKAIRDYIAANVDNERVRDFLNLALTDTLRTASRAGAGWPYIAPSKYHEKQEKDAFTVFSDTVYKMLMDLRAMVAMKAKWPVKCILLEGDARRKQRRIRDGSIDLAVTSPPYLNNYDYADRTRLELYFFGHAKTWHEISTEIRSKLMMSATTQVNRSHFNKQSPLSRTIEQASPQIYEELVRKITELGQIRLTKGGKKSYDYMVAGYFNDMYAVLRQIYRYLKPRSDFILVLGDSAPYGVHIPTEEYLGQLAVGIGYSGYEVKTLRVRGRKWANNPQRHKVLLRESILRITR